MYPTRVFILTSQPLFAQGVQSLLSGQPGIEVVGVATVDPDVFAQVQAAAPDVVIIEAGSGGQSRLVAQVLESIPGAKVVGLTLEDNRIHTSGCCKRPDICKNKIRRFCVDNIR